MLKKLSIGGYLSLLAAILGVVGTVLTIVSGTISADNPLAGITMIVGAGVVGVVLAAVSAIAPASLGNYDLVSSVSIWAAIALFCYTFGAAVSQRIMLIAGLFSYNSGNKVGWSVFYVSVAAWACLLVGSLVLVVSGFLRTVKQER